MGREVGHLLDQVEVLPGVPEAIQLLCGRGLKVAVITNQSAVGRGLLTEDELRRIHRDLEGRLAASGARVDGFYYCPHHPTEGVGAYRVACDCRKPNVGLAERAAAELMLDLGRSYVVGDQATDMELAMRIGARGIFIQGRSPQTADRGPQTEDRGAMGGAGQRSTVVVRDLLEAANWIVQDFTGHK